MEQKGVITKNDNVRNDNLGASLKFVTCSAIGLIMFFAEISINGTKAIPIQHIVNLVNSVCKPILPYYALGFVILGAVFPILNKSYKGSTFNKIFTVIKIAGAVLGVMAVFRIGPTLFLEDDYLPFLYNSLVMPITILIQVSGLGFVFLMNFGLAEFFGALMHKVMRLIWKTPGESVIIATGFSTVAVSFLMIVSNVLGLNEYWNLYFLACLFVTFAVTAVTARIYPINRIPDTYYDKPADKKEMGEGGLIKCAWNEGVSAAKNANPLYTYFKDYYMYDAVRMVSSVTASILSIGLLGILIANMTPLFDIVGYLFYPFTLLMQLPEPMLAAKAAAMEIAEMFLPAMMVVEASLVTKFTIAVTSVSAVLFFSASIPSLLATDIPVKLKDIVLIWIERTILSLIMAAAIGHIFL